MHNTDAQSVIIFIIACSVLILLLSGFITFIIYKYQQKQNSYFKNLAELKITHENDLLQSKLEIQEQTFANISREIHDNIGQKLTLAKLYLNTLKIPDGSGIALQIRDSITMIGEAINDLSDISRSMSSEIILNNGFIKALESEVTQLNKPGVYKITLVVTGDTIFLDANKELVLFRITQEALNNIVKHADATEIWIRVHYRADSLTLNVTDNGKGIADLKDKSGNGIINMTKRAKMLNGAFEIESQQGRGTTLKIEIPII